MNKIEFFGVPSLKKGTGIHIKKKNRGKFTEYCDGKVTQECIDKAKKSGNKKLVKRAVFAQNSRSWSKKHQLGGIVEAGTSFIPIVGTYQSYQDYKKDPTLTNLGWTVASGIGDLLQLTGIGYGLGSSIKAVKAANMARKTVKAVNTARKTTRAANQVKMLEYGQKGKNAYKGWVQSGKNVANSNQKLSEANKHLKEAALGLGIASINPVIDVSETVFKRQGGLISKHQNGGLVNQQYSGTWGNRGQGNELQSALENGLSGIWNGVKWIGDKVLNADEYIEDGLAYMVGMLPGGMNSEQMVATKKAEREAQPGEVYQDALGNARIKPYTGVVPVLPSLPANAPSSLIKLHDNMKKLRSSWAVRESQLKKLNKLDEMPKTLTAKRYKEAEKTFNDAVESIGKATHNTDPTKLTKRLKSSFKAEKARSTDDLRAANAGRPSEKDFDYMENIARNDKHPAVKKLLHQYDLKVAKGMDHALARQRRKEMLIEFAKLRNYPQFVTKHTK